MFERFTDGSRQVLTLAQEEALTLRHNYIGTEHLLLGLLREDAGVAARALAKLGIDLEEARAQVDRIVGRGTEVIVGHIPFTPRTKKVLELALRESISLGDSYIGTEHLLLGIARENEGVAARILLEAGADRERIQTQVMGALAAAGYERHQPGARSTQSAADQGGRATAAPAPTPASFAQALARALEQAAAAAGARPIDVGDLLVALLEQPDGVVAAAVVNGDVDVDALRTAVEAARERAA